MNPQSRTVGIIANIVSLLLVLGSYGSCAALGPEAMRIPGGAGILIALGSIALCFACGVVAVVVFAKGSTDPAKKSSSTVGIVLSVLWAIVSSLALAILWFAFLFANMLSNAATGKP